MVELVVVVLLLTILASVLAPRLLDTSDQAFRVQMEGLTGALTTGVNLYHAAWQTSQINDATVNLSSHGLGNLDANVFGYPVTGRRNLSSTSRDLDCEDVWRGLLNPAPQVVQADPNKERGTSFNHIEPKLGTDIEFVAGQDSNISDAGITLNFANNAQVCQFISLHFQSVDIGAPKPTIYYDTRTGSVRLDLERVY